MFEPGTPIWLDRGGVTVLVKVIRDGEVLVVR